MFNQKQEKEIYTAIGQFIIDSLAYNEIEEWEKLIFTIKVTDGLRVMDPVLYCKDLKKRISTIPTNESRIDMSQVIEDLKEFTKKNDYTPWNKLIFEITPNHKFDIQYSWDQDFHENRW